MKYEDLDWQACCNGDHRTANFTVGAEQIEFKETEDGVYMQSIVANEYFRQSKIVPNGQAWVTVADAEAALKTVIL